MNKRIVSLLIFFCFTAISAIGQDTNIVVLDLEQSLEMAAENNQLIKIFQFRIDNSEGKLSEMKSNFYPRIKAEGNFAYNSDPNLYIREGELNSLYSELIDIEWLDEMLEQDFPLPPREVTLINSDNYFYKANIGLYQPLTQLTNVNTGKKLTKTDVLISEEEKRNIVSEVMYGVKELFYGIIYESKLEEATEFRMTYKKAEYKDALNGAEYGEVLYVDVVGMRAEISEQEQELLRIQNKKEGHILALKQLLGIPYGMEVLLDMESGVIAPPALNRQEYTSETFKFNPKINIAGLTLAKADLGIKAAKREYIPGLSLFMQYRNNYGIPLIARSSFLAGINLEWEIFSSGERSSVVQQRKALWNEANEDLSYKQRSLNNEIEQVFLNIRYAEQLKITAAEALEARREELRILEDAVEQGEALPTKLYEARADFANAEANVLGANINYLLLLAKLEQLQGN